MNIQIGTQRGPAACLDNDWDDDGWLLRFLAYLLRDERGEEHFIFISHVSAGPSTNIDRIYKLSRIDFGLLISLATTVVLRHTGVQYTSRRHRHQSKTFCFQTNP